MNNSLSIQYKLLGSFMKNSDLFAGIEHLVRPGIWTTTVTKKSYDIIKQFHAKNIEPDIILIHKSIHKLGIDTADLAEVGKFETSSRLSEGQVKEYVDSLFLDYTADYISKAAKTFILNASDSDPVEEMLKIKDAITNVELALNGVSKERGVKTQFREAVQRLKDLKSGVTKRAGFSWGVRSLDQRTLGIVQGINIVAAAKGGGKCLGYGTKIIMFDGSVKEVQDIVIGDEIMGVDSKPRTVLSLARGQEQMYIIKQNTAIDYRCNESHILSLKSAQEGKGRKYGEITNISVKDFLAKNKTFQFCSMGYKTDVEFPEKALPLDPYFIGLWLGDGTTAKPEITTPDKEIVEYIYDFAKSIGLQVTVGDITKHSKCPRYNITKGNKKGPRDQYSLDRHMRDLNLINNKHIPKDYLINSRENRLKLLAGIIDTDGYNHHNGFEIIQKSTSLANQIKFLADSLGFKTRITKKTGTIKSRNFSAEYNKVTLSGNTDIIPLRVEHKKVKGMNKNKNWRVSGIKIVPDGVGDYYGFTLDQDGLFLLEDFTVTHNTSMIVNVIIENVLLGKLPMLFFSMEMPAIEVLTNVISNVRQINSENLRRGNVEDSDMSAIEDIEDSLNEPMFVIDETGGITWQYFEAKVREFRKKNKIPYSQTILVALDYLGLMQNSADEMRMSKEERIEQICTQLMRICKNENIALLKLAQFSRELDKRGNDSYSVKNDSDRLNALRPKMSDLKGSAAIESNAIKILLLYRPEYYGILECDGVDFRGKCEIIIAKDRYGRPGKKMVGFEGKYSRFFDLDSESGGIITTGEDKF